MKIPAENNNPCCPLRHFNPCIKECCAWWNCTAVSCSILSMASSFEMFEYTLEEVSSTTYEYLNGK